jgi:hypothetical protein
MRAIKQNKLNISVYKKSYLILKLPIFIGIFLDSYLSYFIKMRTNYYQSDKRFIIWKN